MRNKVSLIILVFITSCSTFQGNDISFIKYVVGMDYRTEMLYFYNLKNKEDNFSIKSPIDIVHWNYPPIKIFDNQIFLLDIRDNKTKTILYRLNLISGIFEEIYSSKDIRFRNFYIYEDMLYLLKQNKNDIDDNYILCRNIITGNENIIKIDSPAEDLIVEHDENYIILDKDNAPEYKNKKAHYTSTIYKLNLNNNSIDIIDSRCYGFFSKYGNKLFYKDDGGNIIIYDVLTKNKKSLFIPYTIFSDTMMISDDLIIVDEMTPNPFTGTREENNREHYFLNIKNRNKTKILRSNYNFVLIGILK